MDRKRDADKLRKYIWDPVHDAAHMIGYTWRYFDAGLCSLLGRVTQRDATQR